MADVAFIDAETRSPLNLTEVGAYTYAQHPQTDVLIWAFAFDDNQERVWSPAWCWHEQPDTEPTALLDHIEDGGYVVAWNAFFDRHIWNAVMPRLYNWPALRLEQVLCAQAQAEANNLPGALGKACDALGVQNKKDPQGSRLISQLCLGTRASWDRVFETPPEGKTVSHMGRFRAYGAADIPSMRDVWNCTRPLTAIEWDEYHASERINDRGVAVDWQFARAAATFARDEEADINANMYEQTGDPRITVTNHLRKGRWLHEALDPAPELQQICERPPKEKDGPKRFSADRSTREAVLEALALPELSGTLLDTDALVLPDMEGYAIIDPPEINRFEQIRNVIELIEAGNSAAVRKFTRIGNSVSADARLHGMYSFNGAGQTGRFSSRGVQTHNLIRSPVEKGNPDRAMDAIDDIMAGASAETLIERYGYSISRLLARLIRPTFIAEPGNTLIWGDWGQIESRKLAWLSDSLGGERKLDLFRDGQDVYKHAAAPVFHVEPNSIGDDSDERQIGKVCDLSLGFGGAVGAFMAMGRNYGVFVDPQHAQEIVYAWRDANQWCVRFWHELWDAAMDAHSNPGQWFRAGRVHYLFHPTLMHGTLICMLPDGRWLVYPQFRHEFKKVKDKRTGEEVEKWHTSFVKGFGSGSARVELWYGILAENITQASAASLLRTAIVRLQEILVMHTHDELIGEVRERDRKRMMNHMREVMLIRDDWLGDDFPLKVDMEYGPYYTK